MTAAQSETVPAEGEELVQVGGEAHGELQCIGCAWELFPVESLPLYILAGIIIGLAVIGVTVLRRRRR